MPVWSDIKVIQHQNAAFFYFLIFFKLCPVSMFINNSVKQYQNHRIKSPTWLKTNPGSLCKSVNWCSAIDYFLWKENTAYIKLLEVNVMYFTTCENESLLCWTEAGHRPTIDGVFGKEWCMDLWRDKESSAVQKHESPVEPSVIEVCVVGVSYFCSFPALSSVIKLQ